MTQITKRDDGRYEARPIIDGKKHYVLRDHKGEVAREVALLKDRQHRRRLGLPVEVERQPDVTVAEGVQKFLHQYQASSRSKKTVSERLKYLTEALGSARVRDVTTETLLAWNAKLSVGQTTRHNAWRAAKQMFGYLASCGYVDSNPAVTVQRMPGPAKRRVTPFETWAQVEAVATKAGKKYGAMIRLATTTGLRPQEVLALEWQHIDFKRRELRVEQTVRDGKIEPVAKTDESLRTVWLSQRALDALADLAQPIGGGLVFTAPSGGMVNLSNFRKRVWKKALADAKVQYRSFDQCRHTYATLTLAAGAPIEWISRQLGHTKIQTTISHYARWLPRADERIHALIDSYVETNRTENGQSSASAR
jgi:integrase